MKNRISRVERSKLWRTSGNFFPFAMHKLTIVKNDRENELNNTWEL